MQNCIRLLSTARFNCRGFFFSPQGIIYKPTHSRMYSRYYTARIHYLCLFCEPVNSQGICYLQLADFLFFFFFFPPHSS